MESDKHTQIKWETRTVDSFLKFFEDIDKFVLTYNQPVPHLFTHISDNLQEVISELLYVNKPQKYGNRNDVFKATTQDIYEMVQLYFAPRDLAHFIMLLMTSCKRYEVIQKGDYYAPTKLKLYGLRQKFRERFDFLSEGAVKAGRKDAVPAINYKQGGLLNVWTDLTPEGSREPFKQMLVNGRYDSLEDFFEKYFAKVDDTNILSENIKVYKYRIGLVKQATAALKPPYPAKERLYNIQDEEDNLGIPDYVEEDEDQEVYPRPSARAAPVGASECRHGVLELLRPRQPAPALERPRRLRRGPDFVPRRHQHLHPAEGLAFARRVSRALGPLARTHLANPAPPHKPRLPRNRALLSAASPRPATDIQSRSLRRPCCAAAHPAVTAS